MPAIPAFVLKKLYVRGSLQYEGDGFALELNNIIAPGTIAGVANIDLDGRAVDLAQVTITPSGGDARQAGEITAQAPLQFPVGESIKLTVGGISPEAGPHELAIRVVVKDIGPLDIPISGTLQ